MLVKKKLEEKGKKKFAVTKLWQHLRGAWIDNTVV